MTKCISITSIADASSLFDLSTPVGTTAKYLARNPTREERPIRRERVKPRRLELIALSRLHPPRHAQGRFRTLRPHARPSPRLLPRRRGRSAPPLDQTRAFPGVRAASRYRGRP